MNKTTSYSLKNKNGVGVKFASHGGRLMSISMPSADGFIDDILLGYDSVEEALKGDLYLGALCGRYANRIVGGKFTIDGTDYFLDKNDGECHLHGGYDGFHSREWNVEKLNDSNDVSSYKLTLISPDGDQKYPGELKICVTYTLTDDNKFVIEHRAITNKPTIINLTSHPYFNLNGAGNGDIRDHHLKINASTFALISKEIGTCNGELGVLGDSITDFSQGRKIGEALDSNFEQVVLCGGLDHSFVINKEADELALAATLSSEKNSRILNVYTNQPGMHVYTGNHFDSTSIAKNGVPLSKYAGVALETQVMPNSPNIEHFPNVILKPNEEYYHKTIYEFIW